MAQIDFIYTVPVYTRVLQFAYMHRRDWHDARSIGPQKWAELMTPRVDLGPRTGKTSAAVSYAEQFQDALIVCASTRQADNINRRYTGVRALSLDELDYKPPGHFDSTSPLFIFDDIGSGHSVDQLCKFKPERFVHLGAW